MIYPISIHAPTNGATSIGKDLYEFSLISIHAPTNGATGLPSSIDVNYMISIHAPTNGATFSCPKFVSDKLISIHAPTNGATQCQQLWLKTKSFQSTLRRTERQSWFRNTHNRGRFQSTLRRTERRSHHQFYHLQMRISIHAPTNGATMVILKHLQMNIFQSTLRRTERLRKTAWAIMGINFNPRSDERSDSNFAQKNEKNYTKPLNNIIVFY